MKKIALIFAATFALTLIVSACGGGQECPAYSEAEVEAAVDAAA